MKRHWQKKPLLVRSAFPEFQAPISITDVLALCTHDQVQSRMVRKTTARKSSVNNSTKNKNSAHRPSDQWTLSHGPFEAKEIPSVRSANWTVLVQQVNTLLPQANHFLDAFRFIPEARLDDLMISVAGPNGGIGAHVDSYDVFLVQAAGSRRWEIATQFDPALEDNVPLKILQHFKAQHDWVLEPGDLLYLPPNVAHRGTAIGAGCMTWSVGFRAPNRLSLADNVWARHLDSLADADWRDPWLDPTKTPGAIPDRLRKALTDQVMAGLPRRDSVEIAIAAVLSEPPAEAVFSPPRRPHSLEQFTARAAQRGLRLALASRLLYGPEGFYINGEALPACKTQKEARLLQELANHRVLAASQCKGNGLRMLYGLYLSGWIVYH